MNWKIMDNDLQHSYGLEFEQKLKTFFSTDDGHVRRSGRSTLLAKIFTELAIENEEEIHVIDHHEITGKNVHRTTSVMMDLIEGRLHWFRSQGCLIAVRKFDKHKGIISLYINDEFKDLYNSLKILPWYVEKNSIFPINEIQERINYLNNKLLLIC